MSTRRERATGIPYTLGTLDRPLAAYVAAPDGVTAAIVVQALEREGIDVRAAWGPLLAVTNPRWQRMDLVVVFEPDGGGHREADYARVRSALPDAAIVVVSSSEREVRGLLWSGPDAIVVEPAADAVLGAVIRTVLAGYVVVPRTLRAALHPPPLSTRERQMLALVLEGLTNREIAERLYLAESTVKRHLSSTFRLLGVNTRREAAAAVLAAEQSFGMGRHVTSTELEPGTAPRS
jgi:DNA-binding NarL/FixJ family response regulator